MCGINGIVVPQQLGLGGQSPERDIERMNSALAHRGPDGSGRFFGPGFALGHRRLSIIDLSSAGDQPMFNEDRTLALVFNGEIYNYLELIPVLQKCGHVFRSRSDSEVILHAFEEWGELCVERFNGMWAFAIWDTKKRSLFLSRDRLGVKPLCYFQRDGRFVFSSEVTGILAVAPVVDANLDKLHSFLAYGYRTNNGHTLFQGIQELLPGHNAWLVEGQLKLSRFWSLNPSAPEPPAQRRVEEFAELLRDAVRLRFRSDVPVALLQSGGLDSSVICTVVNDEIDAGRLGVQSVTGYTAVHPGHAYDETAAVRALMATCPHVRSIELQPESAALAQALPDFVRRMQEPMASATSYAHWCLMRLIHAQGTKVVINGQGADEALAGYGRYNLGYRLLDELLSRPLNAVSEAQSMHRLMGFGWAHIGAQTFKAVLGRKAASKWRAHWSEGGAAALAPEFVRDHGDFEFNLQATWRPENLDRHLRQQLAHYGFNQILHYEDQSSMSESIEIRSPFVDYRLMEFAFSLPMADRFSGGVTKRILRQAFGQRLPALIAHNHKKLGFATPFEEWSATPSFRSFLQDLVASPQFQGRRIWNAKVLGKRLLEPGAAARGFPVWRFVNTELWLRAFGIQNA